MGPSPFFVGNWRAFDGRVLSLLLSLRLPSPSLVELSVANGVTMVSEDPPLPKDVYGLLQVLSEKDQCPPPSSREEAISFLEWFRGVQVSCCCLAFGVLLTRAVRLC